MRLLIFILMFLAAPAAFAHPGHGAEMVGFSAGFVHPFTGLDHLLAMLAVGLWSATTSRRIWLAPIGFASALLVGALLARHSLLYPPGVEQMIAASVLVLGLLVMTRAHMPDAAAAALVGLFALFHGAAHGHELGSDTALFGMVAATLFLHVTGIGLGLYFKSCNPWWQRGIGASIAVAGVGLALNLI